MTQFGSADDLARRDELLELLYWFEGEGFRGAATFDAIVRFVALDPAVVRRTLDDLVRRRDVVCDPATGEFRLTDAGRREGARRFADEFAPLINQGHGECNDPECGCHADPLAAAECHTRRERPLGERTSARSDLVPRTNGR